MIVKFIWVANNGWVVNEERQSHSHPWETVSLGYPHVSSLISFIIGDGSIKFRQITLVEGEPP